MWMWLAHIFKWTPQGLLVLSFALIVFSAARDRSLHRAKINYLDPGITSGTFLMVAILAAIGVSMIPLAVAWAGADPYYSHIGGVIPWSDAAGYYVGSEHFLQTGELDAWSQRRPLNTAFFAARLAMVGNNFYAALLIQAALFGVAGFLAAYSIARTHGRQAGFAMFAILLVFAARYLPTTLSEPLGITLGAISFALLWDGVWWKCSAAFYAGLFFLTFALLCRPGAMLILPVLVIYAGYLFRADKRFSISRAALATVFILIPFLANKAIIYLYGDGSGAAFSNFATVLYGLAVGGKGWMQVYVDFPELKTMSEAAASAFIYDRAWTYIINQPFLILNAILVGLFTEPLRFAGHLVRLLFFGSDGDPPVPLAHVAIASAITFPLVVVGFLRFTRANWRNGVFYFFLYASIGFLISLPLFYFDGKIRSVAASFPIIAALIVIALVSGKKPAPDKGIEQVTVADERFLGVWVPALLGVLVVLAALLAPMIFPKLLSRASYHHVNCPAGQFPLQITMSLGLPHVSLPASISSNIPGRGISSSVFPSLVSDSNEAASLLRRLTGPAMLLYAYDGVSRSGQYILAAPGIIGRDWKMAELCGTKYSGTVLTIWKVTGAQTW